MKRVREIARIGVAERESDVGDIHSGTSEQLASNFETRFIDQFAEAPAFGLQSTVQGPGLHRQLARDRFQRGVRANHAGAKHAGNRFRDAWLFGGPIISNGLFQYSAQLRICAADRTREQTGGEDQCASARLSYTVMGDGVNVAARLEGINKNFGTTICISDSVVEAAGPEIVARPMRKVQVKGRKHKFMIYELLGITNSDAPELAARDGSGKLCEMTRIASSCFERDKLDEAARRFGEILLAFPGDPLARSLLSMCSATATA